MAAVSPTDISNDVSFAGSVNTSLLADYPDLAASTFRLRFSNVPGCAATSAIRVTASTTGFHEHAGLSR